MKDRIRFVSAREWKAMVDAKADLTHVGLLKSAPDFEVKVDDAAKRILTFTVSTPSIDREQDIIQIDGWQLEAYRKNPVVLFAHDYGSLPIARALDVFVAGQALKSRAQYTDPDLNPMGTMVFNLAANGFMPATSVGFNPLEYSFANDRKFGVNYLKQELLEWSNVPVPCNPEALIDARGKGIDLSPLKAWAENALDLATKADGLDAEHRERLEQLRQIADPSDPPALIQVSRTLLAAFRDRAAAETKVVPPTVEKTLPEGVTVVYRCAGGHVSETPEAAAACTTCKATTTAEEPGGFAALEAKVAAMQVEMAEMFQRLVTPAAAAADPDVAIEDEATVVDEDLGDGDDVLLTDEERAARAAADPDIDLEGVDVGTLIQEAMREERMRLTGRVD